VSDIDYEIIWQIIHQDLPDLLLQIREILEKEQQ